MSKKVIKKRITCPACNGRGKSYGYRYCGRCKGRLVVEETVITEVEDQ